MVTATGLCNHTTTDTHLIDMTTIVWNNATIIFHRMHSLMVIILLLSLLSFNFSDPLSYELFSISLIELMAWCMVLFLSSKKFLVEIN